MIARLLAVTLIAIAMVSFEGTSAEAKVCKRAKTGALGSWRRTFIGARASARFAWKRKARARYGRRYDKWWRSRNKSYGCWSYRGRERCRAWARPCRAGR
ncbi:MAG: hypothetical protein ACR2PI_26405 [Hyphomicrobiaceae bacterium]